MIYFSSLEHLHRFSLELGGTIQEVSCNYCFSSQDWVSHGFVYKKDFGGVSKPVGKRILCSNRGLKQGCGRTLRLHLAERTPRLHYSVIAVFVFMQALLSMSIQQAYQKATGCDCDRNAYRWIQKLTANTTRHRTHIAQVPQLVCNSSIKPTLIGETFNALKSAFGSGENYQLSTQEAFLVS